MINFEIIGKIKSKQRPRFSKGRVYTPEQTVSYENLIRQHFWLSKQKKIKGNVPLLVDIECYFKIPSSYSKKKKEACLNDKLFPTKKPDTDNIAKIVLDSLNDLAYEDDKQVVSLSLKKMYTDDQEKIKVKIYDIEKEWGL